MLKSHYRDIAQNQDKLWWHLGMKAINKSLLDTYLSKNLAEKNLKILDAGCGPGAMLPMLASYGDVIGVDISDEALKYAQMRGKVKKGNILDLDFADETFDLVVCMDVLYHTWVEDEAKALREFNRVLKKGGILLVREPAYNWLRGREDVGSLAKRRFSKMELANLLQKSSFKILKITYANFFLFPIVFILRIRSSLSPNNIKGSSDLTIPAPVINIVLFKLLKFEGWLMKFFSLPFGSSLICIARKV
ncbi:MAG: class I SAM-dependent methyltransferase [Candidatus Daviesbacteria bacterium]|nr:class I SAM-dependent methyltransferase [Candidatus Daviesbacteria bacterium]